MGLPQLSYIRGENLIDSYQSSPGFIRNFCKECGSVLPESAAGNDQDTTHTVPAGLLDDDVAARPESHIFCESKSDAYIINDNLPQHTHYGDGDLSRIYWCTQNDDELPLQSLP